MLSQLNIEKNIFDIEFSPMDELLITNDTFHQYLCSMQTSTTFTKLKLQSDLYNFISGYLYHWEYTHGNNLWE